jgi:hypothetical protein
MVFTKTIGAICVLGLLAAGCLPGPGPGLADQIRAANLPFVDEVILSPKNPWGGKDYESVGVYLLADVTEAQVIELYCTVVTPAGAAQLRSGEFYMYKGVTWGPDKSAAPTYGSARSISGGAKVEIPICP